MNIPASQPHVAAVLAALTGALPASYTVADEEGPQDPAASVPYIVVYADPGTFADNPWCPNTDLDLMVAVRAVGVTAQQARTAADAARSAILAAGAVTVAGRRVSVSLSAAASDRDDTLTRPLFWQLAAYRLRSTPD